MAYAVQNYSWSQKSKVEAVQYIRKYLETVSTTETNFIDKSLAIDVLKRLGQQGLLADKNKDSLKDLVKELEDMSKRLEKVVVTKNLMLKGEPAVLLMHLLR